jgi:5-methylcytosine-specific restriction protein A
MKAYLLTYNPKVWQWREIDNDIKILKTNGFVETQWDCSSKKPKEGDLFFINALGISRQKGMFCSGIVTELHENVPSNVNEIKITNRLYGKINVLLNPDKEKILDINILDEKMPKEQWHPQNCGIEIKEEYIDDLIELWSEYLRNNNIINNKIIDKEFFEGNMQQRLFTTYERNIEARNLCIEHYGYICQVCKLDMYEKYGEVGINFIHVHHINFISNIKKEHIIDPINDLITVCPNCHSMLHRKVHDKYLTIEELKNVIKQP